MLIFTAIRFLLGGVGAILVLQGAWGVIYALADGEPGAALQLAINLLVGVWLFRVGLNGTFSGVRPAAEAESDAGAT